MWLDPELLSTAVMFLTGAALAMFYDLCGVVAGLASYRAEPKGRGAAPKDSRAGPRGRRHTRTVVSFWDLAFWSVVTPLVFAAAFVSNRGELRAYVFLGLGLGAVAYLFLARSVIVAVTSAVREAVARAAVFLARQVARPVRAVLGWAGRAGRAVGRTLGRLGQGVGRAGGAALTGGNRLVRWLLAGFRPRPKE